MEAVQTELINLLIAVVVACVGLVTKSITSYLKKKGMISQITSNKEIAKIVVKAVEQIYSHLDGDKKLEKAKENVSAMLNEKKIKISKEEIDLLVESAVKEMNESIKKELKK